VSSGVIDVWSYWLVFLSGAPLSVGLLISCRCLDLQHPLLGCTAGFNHSMCRLEKKHVILAQQETLRRNNYKHEKISTTPGRCKSC